MNNKNIFQEISAREEHPEKFIWCDNCKTGTKSIDGVCAICFGEEA